MGIITKNTTFNRTEFMFLMPTQIKYGPGKVASLATDLQIEDDLANRNSVMVFTDRAIAAAGLVDQLKTGLEGSQYEIKAVFDEIPSDSDVEVVGRAAAIANEVEADLFVAIGGGSVMDTAKATSVLAAHGGDIKDYEGIFLVPGPCIPIVAIPTTCGTGSEVSAVLVVKDNTEHRKVSLASQYIFPRLAVLDPNIIATLPAKLIAYTGFDALTHAIEAYVSMEQEPIAEALSLRAVEMIADNLETAVNDPSHEDARAKLQIAATMAGMAFTNVGVGAVHAIAHSIGAIYGIHHGLSNAIILPYVMEYNLDSCPERFASLARALGVFDKNKSDEELGRAAIDRVQDLKRAVNIPKTFAGLIESINESGIDTLTEMSMNDLSLPFNPRNTEAEEMKQLITTVIGVK
ncbi:MAG TPA: iron-containing alcohol dehydrogenase [Blastocatellia bacterium]|nr:iron-containing alcohol dehydrogenase [Blastocatellia bacterium]